MKISKLVSGESQAHGQPSVGFFLRCQKILKDIANCKTQNANLKFAICILQFEILLLQLATLHSPNGFDPAGRGAPRGRCGLGPRAWAGSSASRGSYSPACSTSLIERT